MKTILKKTLVILKIILKIIFGVTLSIVLSVCLLMVLLFLPKSCSHSDEYIVTYPQKYITAYCEENYIRADPNLIHLIAAENEIGKIEIPGGWGYYRAIKDVSMEDYLVMTKVIMFGINGRDIVKNKNNDALPEQEILSYHIKKIEIYKNEKSLKELYHIDPRFPQLLTRNKGKATEIKGKYWKNAEKRRFMVAFLLVMCYNDT